MIFDRVHQAALERLLDAAAAGNGAIPAASAEIILGDKENSNTVWYGKCIIFWSERGLARCEDGWRFRRDRRLLLWQPHTALHGLPRDFLLHLARSVTCPHLIIKVSLNHGADRVHSATESCDLGFFELAFYTWLIR